MVVNNQIAYKIWTYEQIQEDKAKFEEVFAYLKMYGCHTMAYSILQPKMNYFIVDGVGIVSYAKRGANGKTRYVLGDPLVSRENAEFLLQFYMQVFPKSCFLQVSERIAKMINALFGFYATPMGIESKIDLKGFDLNGSEKRKLRNNIRNCKDKIKVMEENEAPVIYDKTLQRISKEWLSDKKNTTKEITYLARPLNLTEETGVRTFYAIDDGDPIAFIIFNPLYKNNELIGYCADLIRDSPNAPRGTLDYMLYLVLKKFKREGYETLDLGLSPFADLEKDTLGLADKSTLRLLRILYNKTDSLYHFKSLADHKKQLGGQESEIYFCHEKKLPISDIISLFKICNVI